VGFFYIIAYLETLPSICNLKLANSIPQEGAFSFLLEAVALAGGWLLAATAFGFASSL
jgi:hypothetical protein